MAACARHASRAVRGVRLPYGRRVAACRNHGIAGAGRAFSTQPPMDREPEGMPVLKPASNLPSPATQVTTLPNGLRVASEENYGQVSSVGLFIDAGSMFEDDSTQGVNHFLELMAFQSTADKSAEQITAETSELGLAVSAAAARDYLVYKVDALREQLPESVEILADTVLNAKYKDSEIEEAKRVAEFQLLDLHANPQMVIQDAMHKAAFGDNTPIGRPVVASTNSIANMNADKIRGFKKQFHAADRMVLAGAGVDHARLVSLAETFFADVPTTTPSPVVQPNTTYLGGFEHVPDDPAAPQDYTHMILALPSGGWNSDDVVVECVLDTLLGGGSSFSAGGPGKGMYSRLYQEVLSQYTWVETATAFSLQLANTGAIGMYGASTPEMAPSMVNVLATHYHRLVAEKVDDVALSRARNQLRSAVMMNLELRSVLCDDIGRQFLSSNKRTSPAELCDQIEAVSADDIMRVIHKAIASKPAMAVYGNCEQVPEFEAVEHFFSELNDVVKKSA